MAKSSFQILNPKSNLTIKFILSSAFQIVSNYLQTTNLTKFFYHNFVGSRSPAPFDVELAELMGEPGFGNHMPDFDKLSQEEKELVFVDFSSDGFAIGMGFGLMIYAVLTGGGLGFLWWCDKTGRLVN